MYADDSGVEAQSINPIKGTMSTEHVAGALVIGSLVFLWLIGRGFRGVAVGGVSVGVK